MGATLTNIAREAAEVQAIARPSSAARCRFQALDMGSTVEMESVDTTPWNVCPHREAPCEASWPPPGRWCRSRHVCLYCASSARGAIHLGGCIAGEPGERRERTPRTPVTSRPPPGASYQAVGRQDAFARARAWAVDVNTRAHVR